MKKFYILHRGNVWGKDKISEEEIFKAIGLKENSKILLNQIPGLLRKFKKKTKDYTQKKFPNKKSSFDMIIYHTVHKNGRVVAEKQIYCDVNLIDKEKIKKLNYSRFKKSYLFPKKLAKVFREYKLALKEKIEKQSRIIRGPVGKNEKSLMKFENQLKNYVNQHYSLLVKILLNDKDKRKRIDTAQLLVWADNKNLPKILLQAFKDPSHAVHNNAASSILWLLIERKKIGAEIKIRPVYDLLKHPSVGCKNKAAFLLLELIKQKRKIKIPNNIKNILIKMAQSRQPNNSEPAKQILSKIK